MASLRVDILVSEYPRTGVPVDISLFPHLGKVEVSECSVRYWKTGFSETESIMSVFSRIVEYSQVTV